MGHYRNVCSCGRVISQCRCMDANKLVTVTPNGCPECKAKEAAHGIQIRESEALSLGKPSDNSEKVGA
jgi:hypothetical protein